MGQDICTKNLFKQCSCLKWGIWGVFQGQFVFYLFWRINAFLKRNRISPLMVSEIHLKYENVKAKKGKYIKLKVQNRVQISHWQK